MEGWGLFELETVLKLAESKLVTHLGTSTQLIRLLLGVYEGRQGETSDGVAHVRQSQSLPLPSQPGWRGTSTSFNKEKRPQCAHPST